MNRLFKLTAILIITGAMLVSACDDSGDDDSGGRGLSSGDTEIFTADSVSFTMVYVSGGMTFPTGTSDTGTATVDEAYWIAETELTYELWDKVHDWALLNGYTFANAGVQGDGSGDTDQHPVTTVNWRDSIIWCNALTEWYNAQNMTSYKCVYYSDSDYSTPLRTATDSTTITGGTAGSQDCPYIYSASTGNTAMANCTAKGFRLLTNSEWELSARYRGTDTTNVVTGTINSTDFDAMLTKWTKGDSASGDSADYNTSSTIGNYAVYSGNSGSSTAIVKSKTTGYNTLGLYDMSGNVWEWCFDWYTSGSSRVLQGGSWGSSAGTLPVGFVSSESLFDAYNDLGFRIARTAD